jgi:hypothetical protein
MRTFKKEAVVEALSLGISAIALFPGRRECCLEHDVDRKFEHDMVFHE